MVIATSIKLCSSIVFDCVRGVQSWDAPQLNIIHPTGVYSAVSLVAVQLCPPPPPPIAMAPKGQALMELVSMMNEDIQDGKGSIVLKEPAAKGSANLIKRPAAAQPASRPSKCPATSASSGAIGLSGF